MTQIKGEIKNIVEAVFKELPMGGSPYFADEVDVAIKNALAKFVVEEEQVDLSQISVSELQRLMKHNPVVHITTPKKGGDDGTGH